MEGLQTTTIITCGVCSGYVVSCVVWNLIKRKNERRSEVVEMEEDECSSVDTYSTIRSLFTDSGASFDIPLPACHSIISSESFVSACESLHDRFYMSDHNHNFRNSVIVNEFLFEGKSGDFEDKELRRHNEQGRRHNEEGRRHNEQGRRHNEQGRRHNEEGHHHHEKGRRHNEELHHHNEEGRRHNEEVRRHNEVGDHHNEEGDHHNEEGDHHNEEYSDILKMLLRKRPDSICLEYLSDHELGDMLKNEIENEIRLCLQRN